VTIGNSGNVTIARIQLLFATSGSVPYQRRTSDSCGTTQIADGESCQRACGLDNGSFQAYRPPSVHTIESPFLVETSRIRFEYPEPQSYEKWNCKFSNWENNNCQTANRCLNAMHATHKAAAGTMTGKSNLIAMLHRLLTVMVTFFL